MRLTDNNVDVVFRLSCFGDPLLLSLIFTALWLMLPAYMANNCATLFGGGPPLDRGCKLADGRRILGDHKTLRGFALGTLGGIAVALMQAIALPYIIPFFELSSIPLAVAIAMPLGALTGDTVKSFLKRRIGIESGAMLPVADQLDFIVGSVSFAFVAAPAWFATNFTITVLMIIILMTFPLQLFHNIVAVALGKKKVLW
jgi:CDP-2,3-bis-(O-geranylgeranyl)-sn-glycerol synthase